jgi:tRNA(fMet)-specific endonuclease VapC
MGILIDASVLIAAERGTLDIDQLLTTHASEAVALSAITAAEMLHGIHRAPAGKLKTRREAFVERLLEHLPVLPFDLVSARIHARVWAELATRGITVGERDLMIAATAMAQGYAVAARDERSFPKIPGLALLRW